MLRRLGSSWGFGALLKGLTSVVVLTVERDLEIAHKSGKHSVGLAKSDVFTKYGGQYNYFR